MASAKILKIVKVLEEPMWEERRVFTAKDGSVAVFYDPVEFRMCAYAWDLEIRRSNNSSAPKKLKTIQSCALLCPYSYQPWDYQSRRVLLCTWKPGGYLYDVVSETVIDCSLEKFAA